MNVVFPQAGAHQKLSPPTQDGRILCSYSLHSIIFIDFASGYRFMPYGPSVHLPTLLHLKYP